MIVKNQIFTTKYKNILLNNIVFIFLYNVCKKSLSKVYKYKNSVFYNNNNFFRTIDIEKQKVIIKSKCLKMYCFQSGKREYKNSIKH